MGPVPEGFYAYFRIRFPRLLLCVYEVVKEYFGDEDVFGVYFYKRPFKDKKAKEKSDNNSVATNSSNNSDKEDSGQENEQVAE